MTFFCYLLSIKILLNLTNQLCFKLGHLPPILCYFAMYPFLLRKTPQFSPFFPEAQKFKFLITIPLPWPFLKRKTNFSPLLFNTFSHVFATPFAKCLPFKDNNKELWQPHHVRKSGLLTRVLKRNKKKRTTITVRNH